MGGAGKSALALHIAHSVTEHYPDGQFFIELRGTSETPLSSADAMIRVVGGFEPAAQLPNDEEQIAAAYRSALVGKRALIILDNARDAAQVKALIPPVGCAVVITSRRAIALPAVHSTELGALSNPEAHQLLVSIIGDNRISTATLNEIIRLCSALPLALRVAGTFLATHLDWNAKKYVHALADERQRLRHLRTEDDPELDVAASLRLSETQLARERPVLAEQWQALSVFPESFDRIAAAAVLGISADDARHGLSALTARSMAMFDAGHDRYRMHDLMRDVARGAYAGNGQENSIDRRQRLAKVARNHALYYGKVLSNADSIYRQGGETILTGLQLLDLEWNNIVNGQVWAIENAAHSDEAARLCADYPNVGAQILPLRLVPRQCIAWNRAALAAARRINNKYREAGTLCNLGLAHADLGEAQRAVEFYQQSLAIARHFGDLKGEGITLSNLGLAYVKLGEVRKAIDTFKRSLAISCQIDDLRGKAVALGNLGIAYSSLGKYRCAIKFYKKALLITRELGDRRGEGSLLGSLGVAYRNLDETHQAIQFFTQRLEIARSMGDRQGKAEAFGNLGNAHSNLGEIPVSIKYYEQQLEIESELGDRHGEGGALGNLGIAYAQLGNAKRSKEYSDKYLIIARAIKDRKGEANAWGNIGWAQQILEEFDQAIDSYERGLAIVKEIGDRHGEANALGNLGTVYTKIGKISRAVRHHNQSLKLARKYGYRRVEADALGNLGLACACKRKYGCATKFHEQRLALAKEINDRQGEAQTLGNLGLVYEKLGDFARALEFHDRELTLSQSLSDRAGEADAMFSCALMLDKLGQRPEAISKLKAALVILTQIESPMTKLAEALLSKWSS